MIKKLLLILVALAILITPMSALAASGIAQSTIDGYMHIADRYAEFRSGIVVNADKIDIALNQVTNAKTKAKLVKINTRLDLYLNLGNTNVEKARTLLSKEKVTKADYKLARKYLKLAKRYINAAHKDNRDLTRRLANLHITL